MKSFFALLLLVFVSLSVNAQEFQVNGILYRITSESEKTVAVIHKGFKEKRYKGVIAIPDQIEYNGISYCVTSIDKWAFSGCNEITAVTIPNSITSIGNFSFFGCSGLTSITIPKSVVSVGEEAFGGCIGLISVKLHCKSIGRWFMENKHLKDVELGDEVTSIEQYAFLNCKGLTNINLPSSITTLGRNAFQGCLSLTSFTIPNNVTSIPIELFKGCSNLTTIIIPQNVTKIDGSALRGCSSITSIQVESGNRTFDSRDNCNAVIETKTNTLVLGCKNTIIPNSVTKIGDSSFCGCIGITSILIPHGVSSIDNFAFMGCSNLSTVQIPNSVTNIGWDAFGGTAWYDNQPDGVVYAGKVAIGYHGHMPENTSISLNEGTIGVAKFAFRDKQNLTSVIFPDGMTIIGEQSFLRCYNLTSISIPNSVIEIGLAAFNQCHSLKSITIPNSVIAFGYGVFEDCGVSTVFSLIESPYAINGKTSRMKFFSEDTFNNATLYVPIGTIDKYRATEGWKDFASIKEIELQ